MTVFLPMCADILHAGHINIIKTAAEFGDLTVLLMTDEAMLKYKRKSYMNFNDRMYILKQLKQVNEILPCNGPEFYKEMVLKYKPDYFIHGDDWKTGIQSKSRVEVIEAIKTYNGNVIEPKYTKNISSTYFNNKINNDILYKKNIGLLLRGTLNDLKRTPNIIEREQGISENIINKIINGQEHDLNNINSLIEIMINEYPVMKSTLALDNDTSKDNMWLTKKEESLNSGKIIKRINKKDENVPYYNYMGLSSASISPFKPELIEQLVEVNDNSPTNPQVVMNKGHLMSQLTIFIGPVNFYYKIKDEIICSEMNTGDSCFIMPYVPHSFTSRNKTEYTAIVAVTFSGYVHNIKKDLLHYNVDELLNNVGDLRFPKTVILGKIDRLNDLYGYNFEKLNEILIRSNFNAENVKKTLSHDFEECDINILYEIANIFHVPKSEFEICKLEKKDEVVIKRFDEIVPICYSKMGKINKVYPIARSKHIIDIGGYIWHFNYEITKKTLYYNFLYNYGKETVEVNINKVNAFLEPGDSMTIKPYITVNYKPVNVGELAKIIIFKVPCPSNTEGVLKECSLFAREGLENINQNNDKWW
jgi:cytidyltransferase-like protein